MKIFIICSKKNYGFVPDACYELNALGHTVIFPNCMNNPSAEDNAREENKHKEFKQDMYKASHLRIKEADAVLVLNPYNESGVPYIGGTTFLEMYDAFLQGKPIFMTNKITDSVFADEVNGFDCKVIGIDYSRIINAGFPLRSGYTLGDLNKSPKVLDCDMLVSQGLISRNTANRFSLNNDWPSLILNVRLGDKFLETYASFIDWDAASHSQTLSEHIMKKHWDALNWNLVSKYQDFSKEFAIEFKYLLVWDKISARNMFDEEFINDNQPIRGAWRHVYQ